MSDCCRHFTGKIQKPSFTTILPLCILPIICVISE